MLYFDYLRENVYGLGSIDTLDYRIKENMIGKLSEKNLKNVCSRFEAIFLSYLFLQMRRTIPESDFLKEGFAHRIYEEEFYTVLAEKLAEKGGIGLAEILYKQLKNKTKKISGDENGGNKPTNQSFKKAVSSLRDPGRTL